MPAKAFLVWELFRKHEEKDTVFSKNKGNPLRAPRVEARTLKINSGNRKHFSLHKQRLAISQCELWEGGRCLQGVRLSNPGPGPAAKRASCFSRPLPWAGRKPEPCRTCRSRSARSPSSSVVVKVGTARVHAGGEPKNSSVSFGR